MRHIKYVGLSTPPTRRVGVFGVRCVHMNTKSTLAMVMFAIFVTVASVAIVYSVYDARTAYHRAVQEAVNEMAPEVTPGVDLIEADVADEDSTESAEMSDAVEEVMETFEQPTPTPSAGPSPEPTE